MIRWMMGVAGVLLAAGGAAGQEKFLMVPDWTGDRIMLFSPVDGSLVDADYITNATGSAMASPKEALQVGEEIWVSDQIADVIYRFTLDGKTLIGQVGAGVVDNMRGIEHVDGTVYAAVAAGTYSGQVVMFDTSGNHTGNFVASPSPFDVFLYNGELLVTDSGTDDIERFSLSGAPLGTFHASGGVTGIDFPQQMNERFSNGHVLAAGFSAPAGVYEYDGAGAQVNYWDVGNGGRGVYELENGNILFTDSGTGGGVNVLDPATGAAMNILTGVNGQYVNLLVIGGAGCYADCDGNGVLNIDDFLCFQLEFALQTAYADCDGNQVLNIDDFLCFQLAFALGC